MQNIMGSIRAHTQNLTHLPHITVESSCLRESTDVGIATWHIPGLDSIVGCKYTYYIHIYHPWAHRGVRRQNEKIPLSGRT